MAGTKGAATLSCLWNAKPGWGGLKKAYFRLAIADATGNYKTDGFTCDVTGFGLGTIRMVNLPATIGGYVPDLNAAGTKLLLYQGNNDGGADGPLVEVGDDTPVGTLNLYFSVEGTGV